MIELIQKQSATDDTARGKGKGSTETGLPAVTNSRTVKCVTSGRHVLRDVTQHAGRASCTSCSCPPHLNPQIKAQPESNQVFWTNF